eukprot:TRINITY_DN112319_c0_g1_i1.p1 TRINITY_DN112319_c0_g1~~TRINITY_DN112319_c0_g1_i1.p1  ORF type:complete len:294 (-),score=35.99 TRINITY_DN112319_c0_g1_i1:310-1131(-)
MAAQEVSHQAGRPIARIFTVGHSNHDAQPFLKLLKTHNIKAVMDVRSIPSSGRYPHFKKRPLEDLLRKNGITYRHCPELGNKVDGIAKLLRRPEGQASLKELAEAAYEAGKDARLPATAYMCAEADWRDCHRQVVAQKLLEDYNIATRHILRDGGIELHPADHILPDHYGILPPGALDDCCPDDAILAQSLQTLSLAESRSQQPSQHVAMDCRAAGRWGQTTAAPPTSQGGYHTAVLPVPADADTAQTEDTTKQPAEPAPEPASRLRRWGKKT